MVAACRIKVVCDEGTCIHSVSGWSYNVSKWPLTYLGGFVFHLNGFVMCSSGLLCVQGVLDVCGLF